MPRFAFGGNAPAFQLSASSFFGSGSAPVSFETVADNPSTFGLGFGSQADPIAVEPVTATPFAPDAAPAAPAASNAPPSPNIKVELPSPPRRSACRQRSPACPNAWSIYPANTRSAR